MFRTITTISLGRGRRHIAVNYNHKKDHWCLQWANPTEFGHHFDPPFEEGFKTKAAALKRRREVYDAPLRRG